MKDQFRCAFSFLVLAMLVCTGCAPSGVGDLEEQDDDLDAALGGTTYVEIGEWLDDDAELEAWMGIRGALDSAFDEVCGDTFCEGDYTNLTPLDFTCTVSQKRGRVRECAWTFAASDERVDAATGAVGAQVPFFVCRVRPKGKANDLLTALATDPLTAKLPGLEVSLHDVLGDCFEEPLDVETPPAGGDGPFADVADGLEAEAIDAWYTMTRALRDDFDLACGDTFCEGDFTNVTPLRMRCSEDVGTGRIATCAWSFAGSDSTPKKNGLVRVTREASTCSFAVDATPAELAAALAPGAADAAPLMRALPGATTSIYDALMLCL